MSAFTHLLVLLITAGTLWASTTITPTPAPTKTATPERQPTETPAATRTESTDADSVPFESLTQGDLNVITGNVQRPNGMVWHEGKLYIVCNGDWTMYEVDGDTGETRTYISGIRNGHAMVAELDENDQLIVWVPDFDQGALLRVNPVRAPDIITRDLNAPWGIATLDEEYFLITTLGDNNILKVSRTGEIEELVTELRSPTGIAVNDDLVYVANNGSARRALEWFSLEEDEPTPKPLVGGLQSVTGVTLGPDGYLYFAYALGSRGVVGRVDAEKCRENGGCTNSDVEIVVYTELAAPLAGLTISSDMRLYMHTMFRPEIYWAELE